MKTWAKISTGMVMLGCMSSPVNAGSAPPPRDFGAIQAIQQAADPSAVVAAYANGTAANPDDPKLDEAYVARMVDLGLPEMSYHQAQTLTTRQTNNGLAWAVVAYVDARRGDMVEAISAINLAGQFAPDHQFVARTAGELIAWYDSKADKTKIPDNAKDGLAKVRNALDKQPAFTDAYNTAIKAYQAQTSSQAGAMGGPAAPETAQGQYAPAPQAPEGVSAPPATTVDQAAAAPDQIAPLGYVAAPPAAFYPDYSIYEDYGWGPDLDFFIGPAFVATTPCWWQPCGFWNGCGFEPFGSVCFLGGFGGFHRFGGHGFVGHGGFGHVGTFAGVWHHNALGNGRFFGLPARPAGTVAASTHQGFASRTHGLSSDTASRGWNHSGQPVWTADAARGGATRTIPQPRSLPRAGQSFTRTTPMAPARSWGGPVGAARNSGSVPVYRAPSFTSPHWTHTAHVGGFGGSLPSAPASHYYGGGALSGGFHGGASFGGGGFHGGGFGGGFHGGGGHR